MTQKRAVFTEFQGKKERKKERKKRVIVGNGTIRVSPWTHSSHCHTLPYNQIASIMKRNGS